MIPRYRLPRLRRSTLVLVVAIAALAFPLGVLANHQFSDVPTGASYHDDVEALVAAGITTGCGGGEYCPTDSVTRGQMAQFLNRLGNLDGNTAPSVDADQLDGIHANGLTRFAAARSQPFTNIATTWTNIEDISITVPAAGFVMVEGSATVASFAAGCSCEVTVLLANSATLPPSLVDSVWDNEMVGPDGGSQEVANMSVQWVFPVASAGTHTFYVHAISNSGTATPYAAFVQMTAQYSPFGSTGGSTLGLTESPAAPSTTSADQH
jgi:hypothetical protein